MEFLPYPHVIPTLFNGCGFGPPLPFTATSTCTWIDHPVSGLLRLTIFALLRLGFPSAPYLKYLTSPVSVTRRTVLQKVRGSPCGVPQLVNTGFQVLFHSPPGVLFTFPSQYCFSIGHWVVFSLGRWSSRLPAGFHVSRSTPDTAGLSFIVVRGFHSLWLAFPKPF